MLSGIINKLCWGRRTASAGLGCSEGVKMSFAHAPSRAAPTHQRIDLPVVKIRESSEALLFWDQSVAMLS